MARIGGELIVEILPKILKNEIKAVPQNEKEATYTKKFSSKDGLIELKDLNEAVELGGEKAILIDKKIRAIGHEPGVYTIKNNKRIKLLSAELSQKKLKLKIIQKEGKKPIEFKNEI